MKLQPRQIIALAAIVVFGGAMIFRLAQPSEREVMEKRLASLPSLPAPETQLPPLDLAVAAPVAPFDLGEPATGAVSDAPDFFNLGSQAAKDDMYCSGALSAEFEAIKATAHPDRMSMVLRDQIALDEAGIARLTAEKVVPGSSHAGFTLAYRDKVAADYAAGALRISVADCTKRATALN